MKNHNFCPTVTETHRHKNTPWATSATASATVRGSPPPLPVQHVCLPNCGRRWALSVNFFFAWGGEFCHFFSSALESVAAKSIFYSNSSSYFIIPISQTLVFPVMRYAGMRIIGRKIRLFLDEFLLKIEKI